MYRNNSLLARALAMESSAIQPVDTTPKEHTVVMSGPLSVIMSQALDVAYSKENPLTGQPAVEPNTTDQPAVPEVREEVTALESQAIDHALAAAALRNRDGGEVEDDTQPTIKIFTYGTADSSKDAPEPIDVFKDVVPSRDVPFDIIMVNTVKPEAAAIGVGAGQLDKQTAIVQGVDRRLAIESVSLVVTYKEVPASE